MNENYTTLVIPSTLTVTEQEIDISSLSEIQKQTYRTLFAKLVSFYQDKNQYRVLVGLSGPAGAGKSSIVALMGEFAKQVELPFRFESLGIDAFHYHNDYLLSHKDKTGILLKEHKGRFDTYDIAKLFNALTQFKEGETVSLPIYSRKTHNPVEDILVINHDEPALLLVEGLWVLSEVEGWRGISQLFDYTIFAEAEEAHIREGVVQRHMRGGRTREDAEAFYHANEEKNFELIMQTKEKADEIIPPYYAV